MTTYRNCLGACFALWAFAGNGAKAQVNPAAAILTSASRGGDFKTVESFLSAGGNPDLRDEFGRTPLYYAASFNESKILELLLAYHADPNPRITSLSDKSEFPMSPLQNAAAMGNLRTTMLLVAAGADVNARAATGRTALHFAAVGSHLDVLQFLLEKGADVQARDAFGTSALDDAVWRGRLDTAAVLIAHGAPLNEAETKTGATPINEAAYRGHTPLVRYLLQFNPDLTIPDKQGKQPLENAIRMGKEDSALLLLEAESKERLTAELLGRNAEAAIRKDEAALMEALLRHGVSANGTLPSGAGVLDLAAFAGSSKTVELLLKNGADPNKPSGDGSRPLEAASLKGFEGIAGQLLDHGARVNQIDDDSGETALYAAASFGKAGVVKMLLDHGAKPGLCGKNRKSPYQVAVENGYREIAGEIKRRAGAQSCQP